MELSSRGLGERTQGPGLDLQHLKVKNEKKRREREREREQERE